MSQFYPGIAPIDAYGNGGFRFAGMSHIGSILALPSGIRAWTPGDFQPVFDETPPIEFLLLGTGVEMVWPEKAVRERFAARGIGLEFMSTGAAVRTYHVLLAEKRRVGTALIAVDTPR